MMLNEVAAFNTAALTGESVPRSIRMGEEVLAGMIVTDKVIRIKVIRPFDKSALARILELVQNAYRTQSTGRLFIRKFARVYTPIVIGLAVLIVLLPFIYSLITPQFLFTFNDWLYRALVFLVISCPCALVVSIPLGYFGGIGAASRLGIYLKVEIIWMLLRRLIQSCLIRREPLPKVRLKYSFVTVNPVYPKKN